MDCKFIDIFLKNKRFYCFWAFFALFCGFLLPAQTLKARYISYIERYKQVAQQHQREFGIPAAITIAQGLLESNAGSSYLATAGNNHFGIKCHRWKGEHVEWNDTLKHICYRKYGCPEDSFLDHARFLKGPRYKVLYQFDITDYRSWAEGLRDCGYAEDPNYPQKLIRLIEQYQLYALDGGQRLPDAKQDLNHREITEQQVEDGIQDLSNKQAEKKHRDSNKQQPKPHYKQGKVNASADND